MIRGLIVLQYDGQELGKMSILNFDMMATVSKQNHNERVCLTPKGYRTGFN